VYLTVVHQLATLQNEQPVAKSGYGLQVVADKEDRSSATSDIPHLTQTTSLKFDVSDGKHLVDQQNFRAQMCGNSECETHVHSAGIPLYRRIKKALHASESDNSVKFAPDFCPSHTKDSSVEEYIFSACQLRVEPCSNLKQASHTSKKVSFPGCGGSDAG